MLAKVVYFFKNTRRVFSFIFAPRKNQESRIKSQDFRIAAPICLDSWLLNLDSKNMGLQCGIVGLPNVGKSTLFNCLSNAKAQAANFPFCTIEPNVGVITVPDERLTKLVEIVNPKNVVPNVIEIVDIAGLV